MTSQRTILLHRPSRTRPHPGVPRPSRDQRHMAETADVAAWVSAGAGSGPSRRILSRLLLCRSLVRLPSWPARMLGMAAPKTVEAQRFLRDIDAELQSNAEAAGVSLAFSAAERETLGNVAALIDRKVELRQAYEGAADDTRLRIALSTEIRLIEGAITRMLNSVDMCAPVAEDDADDEVITPTQRKARAAAQSRWKRERMRKREALQRQLGGA
jgi:hypothetical protein